MSPEKSVFPNYLQKKPKNYLKKRIVRPPMPALIASDGEARYPSLWCRLALQTPFKKILFRPLPAGSFHRDRFILPSPLVALFLYIGIPVYDCSGLFIKISQN